MAAPSLRLGGRLCELAKSVVGLALISSISGCADHPDAPTAPTPPTVIANPLAAPAVPTTPVPPAPTAAEFILSGRVTATNGGQPLGGLDVSIAGYAPTKTDNNGSFQMAVAPRSATYQLGLFGSAIIQRTVSVVVTGSRSVAIDAIALGRDFDLGFYRQLVRDGFETTEFLRSVRHFGQPPRIYLRTIDENGASIDGLTLDQTAAALINAAGEMTGKFGLAGMEQGTGTKLGQSGWLTVSWIANGPRGFCGSANIGVEGGALELYYRTANCGCGRFRMAPHVVKHELGHALGFFHTNSINDLMWGGTWPLSQCEMGMSAREKYHAAIAYARPNGNRDPDIDP